MIDVDELLERHLTGRAAEAVPIDQLEAVLAGAPSIVSRLPSRAARRPVLLVIAAVVAMAVSGAVWIAVRRVDPPRAADRPAIDWSSSDVRFTMASFLIDAGGPQFVGEADDRDIDSSSLEDEGQYEAAWTEHGVEMRLNVYLQRDATEWWVTDIWTYDGSADGEWLYAEGEDIREPLGEAFVGDIDLSLVADLNSLNAGRTGRLTMRGVTLLPFTEVDIPDPAPMFNGEPPALPNGIPARGVAWTTHGNYVLELALRIGQQECMQRQGFEFELMADQLELGVGVWEPDDVLSVRTERAARERGYRSFGSPADSPGPSEVARQGMTEAEAEAYMAALMGGDVGANPPADGVFRWYGCFGEADDALGGLVTAQETLRQYVSESGIDQETVIESTRADRRTRDALAAWSACVVAAVGESAGTPDELARRFALLEEPVIDREIEVAVADVRCQRETGLVETYLHVYAEYQRASLSDPSRFDELALMRVDLLERAEQMITERGLPIPEFD